MLVVQISFENFSVLKSREKLRDEDRNSNRSYTTVVGALAVNQETLSLNLYPNPFTKPKPDTNHNPNTNPNSYSNPNTNSNLYSNPNPNANANANSNPNPSPKLNPNAYPNPLILTLALMLTLTPTPTLSLMLTLAEEYFECLPAYTRLALVLGQKNCSYFIEFFLLY